MPSFVPDLEHDRWRSSKALPLSRDSKVDQKFFAEVGRRRSSLASPLVDTRRQSRLSLIRAGSLPRLSVKYDSLRAGTASVEPLPLLRHGDDADDDTEGYGDDTASQADNVFERSMSNIVNPLQQSSRTPPPLGPVGSATPVPSDMIALIRACTPADVRFGTKSTFQFPSLTSFGRCISPPVRGSTSISRLLEANLAFVGITVPPRSSSPLLRRSPTPGV